MAVDICVSIEYYSDSNLFIWFSDQIQLIRVDARLLQILLEVLGRFVPC